MSTASNLEAASRQLLADNGEADPHPALLADTMRELAYAETDTVQESLPTLPKYTVDKNTYDVPCTHPLCDTLHKRLPWDHEWARTEWVILEDGSRSGWVGTVDPFETKREALDYLRRNDLA